MNKLFSLIIFFCICFSVQLFGIDTPCDEKWKFMPVGVAIGRNSMQAADIDNDGAVEIICSAFNGGWYVMRHNAIYNDYTIIWSSSVPEYPEINEIELADLDSNGFFEIYVCDVSGKINIYSGSDFSLIRTVLTTGIVGSLSFGDANNDGETEMVVVANQTSLYSTDDFHIIRTLMYGTEASVGDVDNDGRNEIVYASGNVVEFSNNIVNIDWTFPGSDYGGEIELSDLDSDVIPEIILKSNYGIYVYDAVTESLRYSLTDRSSESFAIGDINNDGVTDIITGDDQWGSVRGFRGTTGESILDIPNPNHGVSSMTTGDFDGNDTLDVIWASGAGSSGADNFYVANLLNGQISWESRDLVSPFTGINIADLDMDGKKEIVAVSNESQSGYDQGTLTVFDVDSKAIKWQSDLDNPDYRFYGTSVAKITDIDYDGVNEIIISSGHEQICQLWILNGETMEIELYRNYYPEEYYKFYSLDVADVDKDGDNEIIALTANKAYCIDSKTLDIEWYVPYTSNAGYLPSHLNIGDIDTDGNPEIVFSKDEIFIIDGITHHVGKISGVGCIALGLMDHNNDLIVDIIAGDLDGNLKVIYANNDSTRQIAHVSDNAILSLFIDDVNNDSNSDIIFISDRKIYLFNGIKARQITPANADLSNGYNNLALGDLNNDNLKEIVYAPDKFIIVSSTDCYNCLWFDFDILKENVSCTEVNDGYIRIEPQGGVQPYEYAWDNGSILNELDSLEVGTYSVTITDNSGCSVNTSLAIEQSHLNAALNIINVSCSGELGSADPVFTEGTPPYIYLWNNGSTDTILTDLSNVWVSVTITDAKKCQVQLSGYIDEDQLMVDTWYSGITCFGQNNGYIGTYVTEGELPYNYSWSNGTYDPSLNDLASGTYSLTITDNRSCTYQETFIITEPAELEVTTVNIIPDDPLTSELEGSISLEIAGGVPPYSVLWDDPLHQTEFTISNLSNGTYSYRVLDYEGCSVRGSVNLDFVNIPDPSLIENLRVFFNAPNDEIIIESLSVFSDVLLMRIYSIDGKLLMENPKLTLNGRSTRIDCSHLTPGIYLMTIFSTENQFTGITFNVTE